MTTKIANILQCYALGMGIKQISRSFELSRNTVRRYVRLFQECGIPIKELAAMPSARIQEMFSEGVGRNREPSQRQLELEPPFLYGLLRTQPNLHFHLNIYSWHIDIKKGRP